MAKITTEYYLSVQRQLFRDEIDLDHAVDLLNEKASEGGIKGYYCVKNSGQIRPGTCTLNEKQFTGVTMVPVIVFEISESV